MDRETIEQAADKFATAYTGVSKKFRDRSLDDAFSQGAGSRWLTSASYFAIKNINVGYNIPKSLIKNLGISGLKLFGTVENAVLFTSRKGLNPQYSFNGTQDNTFVSARIFTFGLNLTF